MDCPNCGEPDMIFYRGEPADDEYFVEPDMWSCPECGCELVTDRTICDAELNADSRPCQSERGHSGDHWTPSDQADKPMWWSTTDRTNSAKEESNG